MNKVSAQSNYGLFMILLSGIVFLLSKYTQNSELKVGIPALKKSIEEMEDQVGGHLPFQASLSEQYTGREWLNQIKKRCHEDLYKYGIFQNGSCLSCCNFIK
jgi:hypothetical protein